MSEIRIIGFDNLEKLLAETHNNTSLILEAQKKQPEREALLGCINAMQSAVESVILAYEELAGGATPVSKNARHAMNAAIMLQKLHGEAPWDEWVYPEGHAEEAFAKAKRLVKKTAPAKKSKRK